MDILRSISAYGATLALIGSYCLFIYRDCLRMPDRVRNIGRTADGTVVALQRNPDTVSNSTGGEGYAPVVEFETSWGNHRHVSRQYQQPSPYHVGQKITVRYYFYKSIREVLLQGEAPPTPPRSLLNWGIGLCLLGFPFVILKLRNLF